jgi:chemotaxis protein CheC
MESRFDESQQRLLQTIFERGAENASQALSSWLGRSMRLTVSGFEECELSDATGALGPEDTLVASCSMELRNRLSGELILVFEDRSGLALTDLILGFSPGTASEWGELEQSAALETANIVGCAFLNAIGSHLPHEAGQEPLVPSPPTFRREYAGSLLQFALMDQALDSDRVFLVRTRFTSEESELAWWLLFVPTHDSLNELSRALAPGGSR